jgi:hypothetical protein
MFPPAGPRPPDLSSVSTPRTMAGLPVGSGFGLLAGHLVEDPAQVGLALVVHGGNVRVTTSAIFSPYAPATSRSWLRISVINDPIFTSSLTALVVLAVHRVEPLSTSFSSESNIFLTSRARSTSTRSLLPVSRSASVPAAAPHRRVRP